MSRPTQKLVWHGPCGYWTEDFSKLGNSQPDRRGIPLCPGCGVPGFQTEHSEWFEGARKYDKDHPGYYDKLIAGRESCGKLAAAKGEMKRKLERLESDYENLKAKHDRTWRMGNRSFVLPDWVRERTASVTTGRDGRVEMIEVYETDTPVFTFKVTPGDLLEISERGVITHTPGPDVVGSS